MNEKLPFDTLLETPLSMLHSHPDHPFVVRNDEEMHTLAQSIEEYGVLDPLLVRPRPEGGYQIISGHRRRLGSELAGKQTAPIIIRDMDDNAAIIAMVDSNMQRENILPSERAKAYKLKMDALKRQGMRTDLTSCQVGTKSRERSDEKIAEQADHSARTVQRIIRLTELVPPLQNMVDDSKLGITPAAELSYLSKAEQALLVLTIESEQSVPSLSQAQRMKKLSQDNTLNEDSMLTIMLESKKDTERVILSGDMLRKYFPKSYSPKQIENTIIKLLESWVRKRQQERSR
ncbi:MAG: ParB/RepB/Spo0J family partition protein [Clostridiales bacterium]|nr:ParB/RepB/Spo0J family partition protein [Clostridiales bacterium]